MHGAAMRGLRSGAQKGVGVVVEEIENTKPYAPIDTRQMVQSVRYKPTGTGVMLYMDAPHAVFMEEGTRPHWPPLQPILEWVERKGLADGDEAYAVARAVQAKIAEKGTAPRRFFRRAMRRIIADVIPHEVDKELRRLARRKSR